MEIWRIHDVITTTTCKASLRNIFQDTKSAVVYPKNSPVAKGRTTRPEDWSWKARGDEREASQWRDLRVINNQLILEHFLKRDIQHVNWAVLGLLIYSQTFSHNCNKHPRFWFHTFLCWWNLLGGRQNGWTVHPRGCGQVYLSSRYQGSETVKCTCEYNRKRWWTWLKVTNEEGKLATRRTPAQQVKFGRVSQ